MLLAVPSAPSADYTSRFYGMGRMGYFFSTCCHGQPAVLRRVISRWHKMPKLMPTSGLVFFSCVFWHVALKSGMWRTEYEYAIHRAQ